VQKDHKILIIEMLIGIQQITLSNLALFMFFKSIQTEKIDSTVSMSSNILFIASFRNQHGSVVI